MTPMSVLPPRLRRWAWYHPAFAIGSHFVLLGLAVLLIARLIP